MLLDEDIEAIGRGEIPRSVLLKFKKVQKEIVRRKKAGLSSTNSGSSSNIAGSVHGNGNGAGGSMGSGHHESSPANGRRNSNPSSTSRASFGTPGLGTGSVNFKFGYQHGSPNNPQSNFCASSGSRMQQQHHSSPNFNGLLTSGGSGNSAYGYFHSTQPDKREYMDKLLADRQSSFEHMQRSTHQLNDYGGFHRQPGYPSVVLNRSLSQDSLSSIAVHDTRPIVSPSFNQHNLDFSNNQRGLRPALGPFEEEREVALNDVNDWMKVDIGWTTSPSSEHSGHLSNILHSDRQDNDGTFLSKIIGDLDDYTPLDF